MKASQRRHGKQASSGSSAPVRVTERVAVTGLNCNNCANGVRAGLRQVPGVFAITVNVGAQEIAVTFDPHRTTAVAIRQHMEAIGIGCR